MSCIWNIHNNKGMPEGLNVDDIVVAVLKDGYKLSPLRAADIDWVHILDPVLAWKRV